MTRIDQIVGDIYRISTWNPRAGITFNQFIRALHEEPFAFRGRVLRRELPGHKNRLDA